jgi:hypothetical protein
METNVEISTLNGLIKGHPDFVIDGTIGDIKSVPLDEHLYQENKIPFRIRCQMQSYLNYWNKNDQSALIVCESRQSGEIRVLEYRYDTKLAQQIADKVSQIEAVCLALKV